MKPDLKVLFRNSYIKSAATAFRIINSYGIKFENINFMSLKTPMEKPVTALTSGNILFEACNFPFKSPDNMVFYGSVTNLTFSNCIFSGNKVEKINFRKIAKFEKWRNSSYYHFLMVHYKFKLMILVISGLIILIFRKTYLKKKIRK